jgi:hypothetical protein
MKLFNEILGFIILSGPLWLILIIILLGAWITHKTGKRFKSSNSKFMIFAGVFAFIFLLLFGDGIAGRIYFKYLCDTKAGVKMYQTIELPASYWDEYNNPTFYNKKNGNFKLKGYRIVYKKGFYSKLFHIENAGYDRIEEKSGRVLGHVTNFMYWGGWLRRNLSPNNTASMCKGSLERSNKLISQIFKPE